MADILIRGFEMPKDYSLWLAIRPDGTVFKIKNNDKLNASKEGVAVFLPAGHGRCIDADALLLDVGEVCEVLGDGFSISGFSREQIENAPTIVTVEGEVDNGN